MCFACRLPGVIESGFGSVSEFDSQMRVTFSTLLQGPIKAWEKWSRLQGAVEWSNNFSSVKKRGREKLSNDGRSVTPTGLRESSARSTVLGRLMSPSPPRGGGVRFSSPLPAGVSPLRRKRTMSDPNLPVPVRRKPSSARILLGGLSREGSRVLSRVNSSKQMLRPGRGGKGPTSSATEGDVEEASSFSKRIKAARPPRHQSSEPLPTLQASPSPKPSPLPNRPPRIAVGSPAKVAPAGVLKRSVSFESDPGPDSP